MYKVRNSIYADAGSILVGKNKRGYIFQGEMSEFSEETIYLDDMTVDGKYLVYSKGRIRELYNPDMTYEQLKAKYIKVLFSNDDQIAIMLNQGRSEEDDVLYEKMQEWREWCGKKAKKVLTMKEPSGKI